MKEKLNDWWKDNEPDKHLVYRHGLTKQCIFVRDTIMQNLFIAIATDFPKYNDYSEEKLKIYNDFQPYVIGTHRSKSLKLPVFEIDLSEKLGIKIILRHNFYNWCISVESDNEIDCDFLGLINDNFIARMNDIYFEGFPKDRIYKPYNKYNNRKNFSVILNGEYEVYTFIYILRHWAIKKFNIFGGMV